MMHTTDLPRLTRLSRRHAIALGGLALAAPFTAVAAQTGHNPVPAEASPVDLPTPQATGPEGLIQLLSFVPARMLIDDDAFGAVPWMYGDLEQQFTSLGLPWSASGADPEDEGWVAALLPLALASSTFRFGLDEELVAAIGFSPLGVRQTLQAGSPPNRLTLFRGEFDVMRLLQAWTTSGYEAGESATGVNTWTIGPDHELNLEHPVQSRVMAELNNLALVDGVIVAAESMEMLEEALATFAAGEGSAALDPDFGLSLASLPDTTVSAMAVRWGSEGPPRLDDGTVPMPSYTALILGAEAGAVEAGFGTNGDDGTPVAPPDSSEGVGTAVARLVMQSGADAETALTVVEERWSTLSTLSSGQPFSELMEISELDVEGNIAKVDFTMLQSPTVWNSLVFNRDTAPFQP